MSRNRQVFGLGIVPPRRLPGIASSGLVPVRSPIPLRASPGFSPGSLASVRLWSEPLDAVGSAGKGSSVVATNPGVTVLGAAAVPHCLP